MKGSGDLEADLDSISTNKTLQHFSTITCETFNSWHTRHLNQ